MKMNKYVSILLALLLLVSVTPLTAKEPRAQLKQTVDQAVERIEQTNMNDTGQLLNLRQDLVELFEPTFNFQEMARRSLGAPARDLSDEELQRFTKAYREFLERLYVDRLINVQTKAEEPYQLESVEFGDQELRGRYARISSTIALSQGDDTRQYSVSYRMVERDGNWGIYDLEIEDMSLVNTYRTQFSEYLGNNSIDDLIQKLNQQTEDREFDKELDPLQSE